VAPASVVQTRVQARLLAGPVVDSGHRDRLRPAWTQGGDSRWPAGSPRRRACRPCARGRARSYGDSPGADSAAGGRADAAWPLGRLASSRTAVRRRWLPCVRRATRRCACGSARSAVREYRGLGVACPSAVMSKPVSPTSMPVSQPLSGSGCVGTSAHEPPTDHPAAARATVTVVMVACSGRDQRTALRPLVDSTSAPCSSRAPLPSSVSVQAWERSRPCKRGTPGCAPACSRRKHACYVVSTRASTSWSTWRWMAASSANAARMAVSCAAC
jgi:hypothetical protein